MRQLKGVILDEVIKIKRDCARHCEHEKKALMAELNTLKKAMQDDQRYKAAASQDKLDLEKTKAELEEERKNSQALAKALDSAKSVIKVYDDQKNTMNNGVAKQNISLPISVVC